MKELAIQVFLTIGLFSVALSLLLVALYWWDDRRWRVRKASLRQMYESDVDLTELHNYEKTTTHEND